MSEVNNPYVQQPGCPPKMLPSFVCYADILGYSQRIKEALKTGNGSQFLEQLHHALLQAYERIRKHAAGFGGGNPFYAVKVFTDNIVVGYPVNRPTINYGEPELGDIFSTFAEFQTGLAMEGFFLRGGIAFGSHYMDEDIVFGDAFLEAVDQDRRGGPPRISLAPSAVQAVHQHLEFYGKMNWAPQYEYLLIDADGTLFLNYLDEAFCVFPDGGVLFEIIEGHEVRIVEGLSDFKGNSGVRAKFEWAARYHNFICQEFVDRNPISSNPESDPIYASAAQGAQRLLDYRIDVASYAPKPRRMGSHR